MRKVLGLICLSLFMGLSLHAEEVDIQGLCKEQREKVNEMGKVINTIHDQSIRDWLNQVWINPIIEGINKQSTSEEKNPFLPFAVYYTSGFVIANQKIDDRIQAYKKDYDRLPDWEKRETVNPYEPFCIKDKEDWWDNPKNYTAFYFSRPSRPTQKYTINDLRHHMQEYVDCEQLVTAGRKIEFTNKVVKFFDDNKLWAYDDTQNLADLIIERLLEFDRVKYATNDYNCADHFVDLWNCNCYLTWGLSKNITLQEATERIQTTVKALSPFKYTDIMEALNSEFKQKGISDTQANKEAEKKLNSIIQVYANKLVEKARG